MAAALLIGALALRLLYLATPRHPTIPWVVQAISILEPAGVLR